VAECPEIGTASQGRTEEEALANLREATGLYLESFPQASRSQPRSARLKLRMPNAASFSLSFRNGSTSFGRQ